MRYLSGEKEKTAIDYLLQAATVAKDAKCLRSKCGSIIVKDGVVIGAGYNSPPGDVCIERCLKDDLPANFKSDKTCCMHAEQRAIRDADRRYPDLVAGSTLYFIRLGEDGVPKRAGKPYCTICSKATLEAGIGEFVLWHDEGVCVYGAKEYNDLSFQFRS